MGVLSALKPEKVFYYFEEICGIPHGSGNTKEISNYLVKFASDRNLKYYQDDSNNVVISTSEDGGKPVAIGFRAKKSNGKYRYFWLYRVKFGIPSTSLATKGDSITFSTPTIEGTVLRRNKPDGSGKHPWKAEATEGEKNVPDSVITGWYKSVYEPTFTAKPAETGK